MFPRLFTRRPLREAQHRQAPSQSRIYAIGDIHGCVEPLRQLHHLIREHAANRPAPRNVVVYLGDYVDRGPDSRGVIDVLLNEPLLEFERIYLKGNHEESLLRFLAEKEHGPQWFAYGGDATLLSYGARPPHPQTDLMELRRAQDEFGQELPPEHLDFFNRLQLMHIEGDYVFVHAGLRPGIALDRQNAEDLLWIRDEFLDSDADFGKTVVHGHSIAASPVERHNRIGIDTGAFATGRLTCLVLEANGHAFLTT